MAQAKYHGNGSLFRLEIKRENINKNALKDGIGILNHNRT